MGGAANLKAGMQSTPRLGGGERGNSWQKQWILGGEGIVVLCMCGNTADNVGLTEGNDAIDENGVISRVCQR